MRSIEQGVSKEREIMVRATRRLLLVFLALGTVWIAGCLPDELPAFTCDGNTILAIAPGANESSVLWACDIPAAKVTPYALPRLLGVDLSRMLGDQVWVQATIGARKYKCWRFDPAGRQFLAGPAELEGRPWVRKAIAGSRDGKKCLFVPHKDKDNDGTYDVFSYPDLKKTGTVPLVNPMTAGRFWWVDVKQKKNDEGHYEVRQIEVFNPRGKRVCSISKEEAEKAASFGKRKMRGLPRYARISDDGTALLLAFGDQGWYSFGLFDVKTGKCLWGGITQTLWGTPLVRRAEVWTLRQEKGAEGQWDGTALIRLRQGQKPDEKGRTGQKMLVLPVDTDLSRDRFCVSPDGTQFVLGIRRSARLLLIPIKEEVTAKDVQSVQLKIDK